MSIKKENQDKQRPIDSVVESNYKGLIGKLRLVSNTQIKLWKVLIITAFVAGFVAALAWAVSVSLSTKDQKFVSMPQMRAQQTEIVNKATVTYQDDQNNSYSGESNTVRTPVGGGGNLLTIRVSLEGRSFVNDHSGPITVVIYNPNTNNDVLTLTGSTDVNGEFADDIGSLSGTYDVKIIPQYYLAKRITNAQITPGGTVEGGLILAGDLAIDNTVNTSDFAILSAAWFQANDVADITKDGTVNTTDFSYMSKNWFVQGDD